MLQGCYNLDTRVLERFPVKQRKMYAAKFDPGAGKLNRKYKIR